jgi:hypothetical protein
MRLRQQAEDNAARQQIAVDMQAAGVTVGTLPAVVNLILYQGDDFYLHVNVNPGTPPVDLTSYTAKAEIRSTPGASTVIATFTATIVDSDTVGLHLPAAQADLVSVPAFWDVQVTDVLGAVTTLAYGTVTPTKDVTKGGAIT